MLLAYGDERAPLMKVARIQRSIQDAWTIGLDKNQSLMTLLIAVILQWLFIFVGCHKLQCSSLNWLY